jgi:hypothetical protein
MKFSNKYFVGGWAALFFSHSHPMDVWVGSESLFTYRGEKERRSFLRNEIWPSSPQTVMFLTATLPNTSKYLPLYVTSGYRSKWRWH